MKRNIILYAIAALLIVPMQSCFVDDDKEFTNDNKGNFEQLWTIFDEYYCFFDYKNVDWDSIHTVYSPKINEDMTGAEFFAVCSQMIGELKDGHVNLYWPYDVGHNWSWMENHPVNYDERIIDEYYLNFGAHRAGGLKYALLPQNIGYIYYGSFTSSFSNGALDYILTMFEDCDGIIIDIRNNGGGLVSNVSMLAGRFTSERVLTGYECYKNGKGHNDFSKPEPTYLTPYNGITFTKPVVVLTNRGVYSAANDFTRVMKVLPNVTIIGDTTGGGSGVPINFTLSNGMTTRLSTQPVLNIDMEHTEFGIAPTEGFKVDMDINNHTADAILDCAIQHLSK